MPRPVREISFLRQPLDKIMSGAGAVRVLRALLAHGGHLPVSRLEEDTLLTPVGVRGVLADLDRLGIVEAIGNARTRLYQAKPDHPLTAALAALFEAERQRVRTIEESVRSAVDEPMVLAAWLFGSAARGEDRVDSDLDIAVVIDGPSSDAAALVQRIREKLESHERRLGFTASVVPILMQDIPALKAGGSLLWSELLRDAEIITGPSPRDLMAESVRTRSEGPKP